MEKIFKLIEEVAAIDRNTGDQRRFGQLMSVFEDYCYDNDIESFYIEDDFFPIYFLQAMVSQRIISVEKGNSLAEKNGFTVKVWG